MESEAPQKATEKDIQTAAAGPERIRGFSDQAPEAQSGLSKGGKGAIAILLLLILAGLGYCSSQQGKEAPLPVVTPQTEGGAESSPAPQSEPEPALVEPVEQNAGEALEAPFAAEEEGASLDADSEQSGEPPLQLEAADGQESVEAAPLDEAASSDEPVQIALPQITTWAITAEGIATIAGRAEPGASVQILLDGKEVERGQVGGSGDFALVSSFAPNPNPSFMTLRMVLADGRSFLSEQGVALGPIVGPQPDQPAVKPLAILLDETGAVVLQDGQTEAPETGLSLKVIASAQDQQIQLSGLGLAGSSLYFYLDDALLHQAEVAASGQWTTSLPPIAPGRHLLRIDQIDAQGVVSARLELPFEPDALKVRVEDAPQSEGQESEPSQNPEAPIADLSPTAPSSPVTITVRPGHSLWAIAREQLGAGVLYVQVLEANKDLIRNPDLIYPGQIFNLPKSEGMTP